MKGTVLIVDDKVRLYESLAKNFQHQGYRTVHAASTSEALKTVLEEPVDAVLLDIMLGAENGIEVLRSLKKSAPTVPVIMITGYASVDSAVESMKLGAFDYVKKPLDFDRLLKTIENATEMSRLNRENRQLRERLQGLTPRICMHSGRMISVVERAAKLAATDLPVLIVGENGTGKEIIADYIHAHSPRAAHPMVKINCAAFPESLLDNELFGHEKGAYTGADGAFQGVFERAHASTLFLDEIGDMPPTIQAKILRTLQNREIRRLGGQQTLTVDVRFIAATNKKLERLIAQGSFREDLFYRLNAAMLEVPPLRERKEDLPQLAEQLLGEFAHGSCGEVKRIGKEVLTRFMEYDWPGNVRELRNVIHYAAAIGEGSVIEPDDLPPAFYGPEVLQDTGNVRLQMERMLIIKTLQRMNNNKKRTAEFLQMSRKTLYFKMQKHGIQG